MKSLIELAEAKKVITTTVKSLDDLAATGDAEITSLAEQIRTRIDKEDARLEVATQSLSEEIEEVVGSSEIERQLEERRRRLESN
jgi:cell division protein ZapA (FtsZ GTPase activity inhibitor)